MPRAIIKSNYYDDKVRAYRASNVILGAGVIFALVAGFTPIGLAAYAAVVLATMGVGLGLRWTAMKPQTAARNFLYLMAAGAAIGLTAALLFAVTPSVAMVFAITAVVGISSLASRRFLKKAHSGLVKLPLLTKLGYGLGGLAFAGLAAGFCLMAAGVLPTFILLPVLAGAGIATSIGVGLVTAFTPSSGKKAWDGVASAASRLSPAGAAVGATGQAIPGYQLVPGDDKAAAALPRGAIVHTAN